MKGSSQNSNVPSVQLKQGISRLYSKLSIFREMSSTVELDLPTLAGMT